MPMIKVPYLVVRARSYAYRREVPYKLRSTLGFREWKFPLGKGLTLAEAARRCEALAKEHDALIATLRAGDAIDIHSAKAVERLALQLIGDGPEALNFFVENARNSAVVDFLNDNPGRKTAVGASLSEFDTEVIRAARNGGKVIPTSFKLSTAYKLDKEKYGADRRDEKPIALAVETWITTVGDSDFRNITRADVLAFRDACRRKGQADATIRRRLVALQGIHSRLRVDLGLDGKSLIWSKLSLKIGDPSAKRLPFHAWHEDLLDHYIKTSTATQRTKLMLRIIRGLGLGVAECAGIRAEDVDLKSAIPAVLIRGHAGRRLKGDESTRSRQLPLVGDTLEALREAVANPAGESLFVKTFTPNVMNTLSQTLTKCIRAAGVPRSKRLTLYSWRHSFLTQLEAVALRRELINHLMGHARGGEVKDSYRPAHYHLEEIRDALIRAEAFRGKVNPLVYTLEELPPERR